MVVINGPYRALKNLKDGDAVKVSKDAGGDEKTAGEAEAKVETD